MYSVPYMYLLPTYVRNTISPSGDRLYRMNGDLGTARVPEGRKRPFSQARSAELLLDSVEIRGYVAAISHVKQPAQGYVDPCRKSLLL